MMTIAKKRQTGDRTGVDQPTSRNKASGSTGLVGPLKGGQTSASHGVLPPSEKTLAKYGLSESEWLEILKAQGGVCAVCKRVPNGRLCTDHQHIKGWRKLPPEKRKIWVRGLLCWTCNHYLVGRGVTINKSRYVTIYLEQHEERVLQHALRGAA